MSVSVQRFRDLLNDVQYVTGKTMAEISRDIGYKGEKTISQLISKGSNLDPAYRKVLEKYYPQLNKFKPDMYTVPTLTIARARLTDNGQEKPDDRERIIEELKERIRFLEELVKNQNELIKSLTEKK